MTVAPVHACTPSDPHVDGWDDPYDAHGHPRPYTCTTCGRPATPAEADAEDERRFDASLPEMPGYAES